MSIEQKSVLIVDDMKTVREKLMTICKELGIGQIYEASDGAKALAIAQKVKLDLVLSDWNMPYMNGIELLGELRTNEKTKEVPVIFITAESEKDSILRSLMQGASDYIVKPFADYLVKQKICSALKVKM